MTQNETPVEILRADAKPVPKFKVTEIGKKYLKFRYLENGINLRVSWETQATQFYLSGFGWVSESGPIPQEILDLGVSCDGIFTTIAGLLSGKHSTFRNKFKVDAVALQAEPTPVKSPYPPVQEGFNDWVDYDGTNKPDDDVECYIVFKCGVITEFHYAARDLIWGGSGGASIIAFSTRKAEPVEPAPWYPPQPVGFGKWLEVTPGEWPPCKPDDVIIVMRERSRMGFMLDANLNKANAVSSWCPSANPIVAICIKGGV